MELSEIILFKLLLLFPFSEMGNKQRERKDVIHSGLGRSQCTRFQSPFGSLQISTFPLPSLPSATPQISYLLSIAISLQLNRTPSVVYSYFLADLCRVLPPLLNFPYIDQVITQLSMSTSTNIYFTHRK